MIDYRLYLVTDDPSRYVGNWLDNVVAAVEGGVTCVQYRDTESPRQIQYERILKLRDAIGKTPIIVNNDAELAAAVKAEGVHVGQNDMPVDEVRAIVGSDCEIGLSITDLSQLAALPVGAALPRHGERSSGGGADCLGIGPVFDARKTKADASEAMGVDGLAEILSDLRASSRRDFVELRRTVAIGGITLANAPDVLATGVGGLAVVSAFSKAADPFSVARAFRNLF